MENKELGNIKASLKTRFQELDKLGYICGMTDMIMQVIDEADDFRASRAITKLFLGDEVELLVTPCAYVLTMTIDDRDNYRKHHCFEYNHTLPDESGHGEVFSINKYTTEYDPEFREDIRLPQMSLFMSDRVTHLRVLRQDGPLAERTIDRKPYGERGMQEYKEQFVADKTFVSIKNEMASTLDKIVERIHE